MLKPLNGGLFVKRLVAKKRGSIIIPSIGQNETVVGEVISVSEDFVQSGVVRKMFVKAGDKVVYNTASELKLQVGEDKQILIYITNVIAVITGEDDKFTDESEETKTKGRIIDD